MVLYTAMSTLLSIDVSTYGWRSASTCSYRSLSTPMVHTSPGSPASAAASSTPGVGRPGGGVDDVGPASYIAAPISLPRAGSLKPIVGSSEMYSTSTSVSGLTHCGAGHEPGLELLDQVVRHAADEAELAALGLQRGGGADEERALLLGEHDVVHVVGASTTESMSRKCVSGYAAAAWVIVSVHRNPVAITSWFPPSAAAATRSARSSARLGRRLGRDDAEVGDGPVESGGGGVVERLVATAGDVEHQGDGGTPSPPAAAGARWLGASWFGAGRFRCHRLGACRCGTRGFGARGGGPGECAEVDALTDARHRWTR